MGSANRRSRRKAVHNHVSHPPRQGLCVSDQGADHERDGRLRVLAVGAEPGGDLPHPVVMQQADGGGSIPIVAYDDSWPRLFDRERQRIVAALGDRALAIEHIGSTSVPELAAKPIIDIMLTVADCADEPAYVPDLEAGGYVLRIREPDGTGDSPFDGTIPHRMFKGSEIDLNLHVWSSGSPEIDRHRAFRDWLRSHSTDLALYERTKLELAARAWENVQQYADAKATVIEVIHNRAAHAEDVHPPASGIRRPSP